MKTTKLLLCIAALSAALLTTTNLKAESLTTLVGDLKYESHALAKSSKYNDGTVTADLKLVSHGARQKKAFGLVTVKVYYAELLLAKPEAFSKEDGKIVNSLEQAGPIQLRLTMLRDIKGQQITDSFKDALAANDITADKYSAELKNVLQEIDNVIAFKTGEVFSIAAQFKGNSGVMMLQKPDGRVKKISGNSQFIKDMFQIWFGKPVDDKLALLKKDLLK